MQCSLSGSGQAATRPVVCRSRIVARRMAACSFARPIALGTGESFRIPARSALTRIVRQPYRAVMQTEGAISFPLPTRSHARMTAADLAIRARPAPRRIAPHWALAAQMAAASEQRLPCADGSPGRSMARVRFVRPRSAVRPACRKGAVSPPPAALICWHRHVNSWEGRRTGMASIVRRNAVSREGRAATRMAPAMTMSRRRTARWRGISGRREAARAARRAAPVAITAALATRTCCSRRVRLPGMPGTRASTV